MRWMTLAIMALWASASSFASEPAVTPLNVDVVAGFDFMNSDLANAVINTENCSGTIIAKGAERAYGVSAAHCGVVDGEFRFWTRSGKSGTARWVAIDRDYDLGMFVCWSKDVDSVAKIVDPLPENPIWLAAGYPADSHGTQERKELRFSDNRDIQDSHSLRTIRDRNGFRLVDGHFAGGDSGGAIMVVRPQAGVEGLAGVISHGADDSFIRGSSHRALVKFVSDNQAKMAPDCRDCWIERWQPGPSDKPPRQVPPPPNSDTHGPGQHDLPEYIDSDRERALLIIDILERLKKLEAAEPDTGQGSEEVLKKIEDRFAEIESKQAARLANLEKKVSDLQSALAKQEQVLQNLSSRPPIPGPKGEAGPQGPPGERGSDGKFNEDDILKSLIEKFPDRKFILMRDGKVIDSESYSPTEPIILDVRSILKRQQ